MDVDEVFEARAQALAEEHFRRGSRIPKSEHAWFYRDIPEWQRDDLTERSKQLVIQMKRKKDREESQVAPWLLREREQQT